MFKKRLLSLVVTSMVVVMAFGSAIVLADDTDTKKANTASVGSDSGDINKIDQNAEPVGKDETQGQISEYYNEATYTAITNNPQSCDVYATLPSSYTVRIPKTVILEGISNGSGSYTVRVTGDIAGDETIVVAPAATVAMKQDKKNDVTADISQNSEWTYSDLAESKNDHEGTITASGLTAGSWKGTFNFDISLK